MRAVLLFGKEDLREVEVEDPRVGSDDVLIKIRACGVCPTDVRKFYTLSGVMRRLPMNLGHEWAGDVVEVGENVKEFKPGDRVVGTDFRGYAEYAVMSRFSERWPTLTKIPEGVSYEEATFTEPLADCIHSLVDQGGVRMGDVVLVMGAGQMGLQHLMVAKHMGAKVIVSEVLEERVRYARELGADYAVNPLKEDLQAVVEKVTDGEGVDAVIITAVNQATVDSALKAVRKRGRVVLFAGVPRGVTVQVDTNLIHYKESMVVGSEWIGVVNRDFRLYKLALDLIASGAAPVGRLITHRFRFSGDEILKAFDVIKNRRGLKAVIVFD